MRTLHIYQLRALGACSEQVDLFAELFGESVDVTEALCAKHFDKFDWSFAAKLLSPQGQAEYDRVTGPASAEYNRVTGLAWAEYNRVTDPAWAEYNRVNGLASAEYDRVRGLAWAEYTRVNGLARAEYDRVNGLAWARLYIAEGA